MYRDIHKRFIIEFGSYSYGNWEAVLAVSWRTKKAGGMCNSVRVWRLDSHRTAALFPGVQMSNVQAQEKVDIPAQEREFIPFSPPLWELQDWMMPPSTVVGINLLYSNVNLFPRNTFTGMSRNNVLPPIWVSLSPLKLTDKINHHSNHYTIPCCKT